MDLTYKIQQITKPGQDGSCRTVTVHTIRHHGALTTDGMAHTSRKFFENTKTTFCRQLIMQLFTVQMYYKIYL